MLPEMEVAINEIDKVADSYVKQIRKTVNDDEKCKNLFYIRECEMNLEKVETLVLAKMSIKSNFFNNCLNKSDLGICKLTTRNKYCCNPENESDCASFEYNKEE